VQNFFVSFRVCSFRANLFPWHSFWSKGLWWNIASSDAESGAFIAGVVDNLQDVVGVEVAVATLIKVCFNRKL
jgi:hypothetical protein